MITVDDPIVVKPCVLYANSEDKQHRILSDFTTYTRVRNYWVYDPDTEILKDFLEHGRPRAISIGKTDSLF